MYPVPYIVSDICSIFCSTDAKELVENMTQRRCSVPNSILACQQHFPPHMAVTFAYHYTSNMHAIIQHVPSFTHPSIYTLNYSRRGAADANRVELLISVSSGGSSPQG